MENIIVIISKLLVLVSITLSKTNLEYKDIKQDKEVNIIDNIKTNKIQYLLLIIELNNILVISLLLFKTKTSPFFSNNIIFPVKLLEKSKISASILPLAGSIISILLSFIL